LFGESRAALKFASSGFSAFGNGFSGDVPKASDEAIGALKKNAEEVLEFDLRNYCPN
jgi:hypothetical protein